MDVGAPVWLNPTVRNLPREDAAVPAPDKAATEAAPAVTAPEGDVRPATLRAEIAAICLGEGGYPHSWPRHAACPACGEAALAPAFAKYGFSHARCGKCGFVCVDPYPPEDILTKLYNGRYYTQVREFFELPMLRDSRQGTPFSAPEDLLKDVIATATAKRKTGRWLDVGGGLGAFAGLVRRERPGWDVRLNEMNLRSIEIARETFGLPVITDGLQALKASGQRFDVVSTVAVLEHITDPLGFMVACMDILAPGGCLVNVLPHFSPLNAAVSRGSSPNVVPPYHVSLFGEQAMRALVARLPGVEEASILQQGDAAFHLIEHVDFGDYWDITIPDEHDGTPRSVSLKPYPPGHGEAMSILGEADTKLGTFFAETDGRLYLVCYVRKAC
jgi:SAM-dependent methyltransferase